MTRRCRWCFIFFFFFKHLIWERWGGKEINRAVLSQSPIRWDTYFLNYCTFPFSLFSFFFILPSSPKQYLFLPANCLFSQHHIYKLSDVGGLICFHSIKSCAAEVSLGLLKHLLPPIACFAPPLQVVIPTTGKLYSPCSTAVYSLAC